MLTGAVDTINIWVEANHEFIASPKHVVIPLGEKIQVDLNGTGSYSAAISGSGVQVTNELISGDAVGSGLIQYTDNFTALTVTVGFQVVAPQQFNLPRLGDARLDTVMHTIADVTGDGLDDILLGTWDSDITGLDSGAVYLYASNDSGFDVSPSQTWSGKQRDYRFGNAIDTGDINGDGAVDLMIGSFFADEGLNRNGAVYLYLNQDGQLPNEPNRIFVGTNADDYFGHAIGICDFNGDGRDDFAIGARNAEDTNASPRTNNQGAIYIFLGQDGGIPTSYNQVIWGQHWDADNQTWSTRANSYWGTALQTGDINDDGLCDLVAGSYFYPTGSNNKEDGAVFVYLGEAPENFSLGGVSATPAWSIIADDPIYDDDEFGRYLQVADINHDDKDDLLITQWRRGPNQGRLSLFLGRSFEQENTPVIFGVDDHDWFIDGTRSSDYFGSRSQAVDVNGDGLLDIITSGPLAGANRLGTNNNQRVGLVSVFLGAPNGLPSTETYWESHGDVLNDWWETRPLF